MKKMNYKVNILTHLTIQSRRVAFGEHGDHKRKEVETVGEVH